MADEVRISDWSSDVCSSDLWAIVTPDARAIWRDETLAYGPGGTKGEVPDSDVVEDQWRTYYGAIFNPARVKIAAMRAEMPRKYWKNLPEAQDIAPLLAGAEARDRKSTRLNSSH